MNANSLNWFQNELSAKRPQVRPSALNGLLARTFEAWINAAKQPPQVPDMVRDLHEQADRYEATQPGYAADLRFAAQRALLAGNRAA
jgi:hypothetical protein